MTRSSLWFATTVGVWLGTAVSVGAQQATPRPKRTPPPIPIPTAPEKEKRFTEPGSNHKLLERFLGKWATESRLYVFGNAVQPEKGTAEGSWLMKGRWLKLSWSGRYWAQPVEGFMLIGYDNFRQNYVTTSVTSMDTGMARAAGDANETGDSLLLYGTIDEYESGIPDRMTKQVWHFASPDKLVLEVYDLALPDTISKVVEVTFLRQP